MSGMSNRAHKHIVSVIARYKFLKQSKADSQLNSKLLLQGLISLSFLLLSFANIFAQSYTMLIFTLLGFDINGLSVYLSWKFRCNELCVYSSVLTCCTLFAVFVIYGGNEGFSCLWVVLFPFLSMIVVDFFVGFVSSVLLQIFLFAIFWTPASSLLCYPYNEQFRLRFPMFFLVSFSLALMLAVSLQKSQYNEYLHSLELEKMTLEANRMARCDALTKLANRRCAYEEFSLHFSDNGMPHCIVMGDIDSFKRINDLYGHEFGDEVLVAISQCIIDILPKDYLKSRWGGEEFLIAANAPVLDVYEQVEKLRKHIESLEFLRNDECVKVTVTFGVAEYYQSSDLNEAINTADAGLYTGKKNNKNCTIIHGHSDFSKSQPC